MTSRSPKSLEASSACSARSSMGSALANSAAAATDAEASGDRDQPPPTHPVVSISGMSDTNLSSTSFDGDSQQRFKILRSSVKTPIAYETKTLVRTSSSRISRNSCVDNDVSMASALRSRSSIASRLRSMGDHVMATD